MSLRLLDQRVDEEQRCALHHRIGDPKKRPVTGELIVAPQMRAQPRTSGGPKAPQRTIDWCSLPPRVGVVVANPTARSILNPRCPAAVLDQFSYQTQQG